MHLRSLTALLLLGLGTVSSAETPVPETAPAGKLAPAPPAADGKTSGRLFRATGTFEVQMSQAAQDPNEDATFGRMLLDKQFQGDLQGTSKGHMLASNIDAQGSGAYVALEKVHATLKGKKGSFVLQHNGTMNRGEAKLSITVVPDSGTDELKGIFGEMQIQVAEGQHSYVFEYTLADAASGSH